MFAAAMLAVMTGVSTSLAGWAFAQGVLLAGLVVLGSFGLTWAMLFARTEAPHTAGGRLAQIGLSLKLPLILAVFWWLFTTYSVPAVVLGSSVLVAGITANALCASWSRRVEV